MHVFDWFYRYSSLVWVATGVILAQPLINTTIASAQPQPTTAACPLPALSRLTRHTIAPGETLVSLSQRYNLIPATLMGFNPILRNGNAPVGREIVIPPYNGIRVEVPSGTSWRDLAAAYGVRADVLFEVNGCGEVPQVAFVPGVNWSPNGIERVAPPAAIAETPVSVISGYPLPEVASVITGYGWQVVAGTEDVYFHSGVDLAAAEGTPVLAVGDGIVAFATEQGAYGKLIVINHQQGLQTRYAQMSDIRVQVGQAVRAGDRIGSAGMTGRATEPHLHFEVRSNSDLGWVAQNPSEYVQRIRVGS
jgi:lysostaphin